MEIEERADGVHISGYVNVTCKRSRPVITPHGRVIEIIEERAFEKTLESGGDITVSVDHDQSHIYANTRSGTLTLYEDHIGLHADVLITDPDVIDIAKKGKIKGWSIGMYNIIDELEQRADDIPIRHIKQCDLDHVTLVVNKTPCYAATSIEVRSEGDTIIETRTTEDKPHISLIKPDYSDYEKRIAALN